MKEQQEKGAKRRKKEKRTDEVSKRWIKVTDRKTDRQKVCWIDTIVEVWHRFRWLERQKDRQTDREKRTNKDNKSKRRTQVSR